MSTEKLTKKQLKAVQFRNKVKKEEVDDAGVTGLDQEQQELAEEKRGDTTSEISVAAAIGEDRDGKEKKKKEKKSKTDKLMSEENISEEKTDNGHASTSLSAAEKKEKKELKRKLREEKEREAKEGVKAKASGSEPEADSSSKKRKRSEDKERKPKAVKKRFTEDGNVEEVEVKEEEKAKKDEEGKGENKYIIFVGNMSFQSTTEEIAKHFSSHCKETPSVRLLTKRGDPTKLANLPKSKQKSIAKGKAADPSAPVSKGCAFVEFKSASALQKALQFHHTQFQGRNINVELTAGGGGKGGGRIEKIRKKNEGLEVERQKLHEKYIKTGKKDKEVGDAGTKEVPEKKEPALPAWGPRAAAASKGRGTATKVPRWAASGSNAVRLSG